MSEVRKPFEEPEVVTYAQDELVIDTVFTNGTKSEVASSDRNLKRSFRPVRAKRILNQLIRLP